MDFLFNEMIWWLIFAYVVGTVFGRYIGFKASVEDVVGSTIDSLIENGYLKTRGVGRDMEILKHTEWCKEND